MFRGHIGREIRARAVFMSEISGHDVLKGKLQILQNMAVKNRFPWKRQC